MAGEDSLTAFSIWRHKKGGTYVVLGIAESATNAEVGRGKRVVVYCKADTECLLYYREIAEFLDGRFTPAKTETSAHTEPLVVSAT